jgi:predicted TIM-barrel enzyme
VDLRELQAVRAATRLPVLVGSGATPDTAAALLEHADALIVGSALKRGGRWDRPVDTAAARAFVKAARKAR